jgi:predicted HTH transcriptional regulator
MAAPPFLSAEVLLKERRVESFRLDFKAGWDDYTKLAIIKTICAFANDLPNQNGGYVILGVEDAGEGKAVLPPRGLSSEELEQVSKELVGQVRHLISPEYVPTPYPEQVDGRDVLVVRCPAGYSRPYSAPERLEKGLRRIPWVRVGAETRKADSGELARQLDEVVMRTPFDAQPWAALTVHDLNYDLVESFLRAAGSGLAGDEHSVEEKLRGLDLIQRVNGHEAPLNAALLFFTSEPHRRFRGAQIDVVQLAEDGDLIHEQELRGPLPSLVEKALSLLAAHNPTLVRKHDDRAEADRDAAWPFAAIEEALINAVHHRGYDPANPDPIEVSIYPDRMVIASYPGPMPGVTLAQLEGGERGSTRPRNRHIGRLLKDLKLAEARRSGIGKIRRAMERAGNPPARFSFDEVERTYFEVTLPIHPVHLPKAPPLPLRLGVPAPASELVGREVLIEQVNRRLEFRNVCLFAPHGRGVSSVLNGLEVAPTGERRHRFDLSRLNSKQFEKHVDDLSTRREDGERLVLLLDHCPPGWEGIPKVLTYPQVRVVAAPHWLPEEDDWWWTAFDPIVVPPLSSADARSLATRLLAGLGRSHAEALALAIEQASAGIPHLVHLLVSRVHAGHAGLLSEPGGMARLLRDLVAQRGDPTGLRARGEALGSRNDWGTPSVLALDRVADAPAGLSYDDLRAGLLSEQISSAQADLALRDLLDEGWLVERDSRITFEHPVLREQWKVSRGGSPEPYSPGDYSAPGPDDEDIPF